MLFLAIHLALPNIADAHPVPVVQAEVEIADETFRLTVTCDVPALVMSTPQGHLEGDLADEFQSLSDRELQERIDDARRSLAERTEIVFDGTRVGSLNVELPTPAALRAVPIRHEAKSEFTLRVSGLVPSNSRTVQIRFPEELGQVFLRLIRQDKSVARVLLKPGFRCQPLQFRGSTSTAPDRPVGTTSVAVDGQTDRPSSKDAAPDVEPEATVINQILPVGSALALFALSLYLLRAKKRSG